jgi:hypothetical protein
VLAVSLLVVAAVAAQQMDQTPVLVVQVVMVLFAFIAGNGLIGVTHVYNY